MKMLKDLEDVLDLDEVSRLKLTFGNIAKLEANCKKR